ncbi:MAG: bifunctional 2',3'-cyclic-nucleotide 2'-phosphodiesterase/3'-nucleotidase [Bacillaceae bacterium]|nr:bifunctional 2',3'-cyclic-nucleotide 2'-phosphodiesterase/3'-nucleotidase [Bacillaceae bacterium]
MKNCFLTYKVRNSLAILVLSLALLLSSPGLMLAAEDEDIVQLRLLETTDIHTNLVNYDYYQDKPTDAFGLIKTAQLIKEARQEVDNSLLFDNGDLIQGSPLGHYVAKVDTLESGETHPVYKVMNELKYDAGNIGNHEFNYGLDFLHTSLEGSAFPYVNANVYVDDGDDDPSNDQNMYDPYVILKRTVVDGDGEEHEINVGVIGFTPPQIMQWDKANLEGKVIAKDIVETAEKFIPEMKEEGADIIVAIPHSGIGSMERGEMEENATYDLSKVEGIHAILFGHSHSVFPSDSYAGIEGADIEKGTLNGVPSVMPGYWGSHLGIIDLTLQLTDGKWEVVDGKSEVRGITDEEGNPVVEADQELYELIEEDHLATIDYVRGPVGKTTAPINSYFAQVLDDPSIQIVTNAQKWYVENYIQGTEYDGIPVLSAGAPFKAGTRGNPDYYTDIPAGEIAIKNVADLYLYPNTVQAVLVNGSELREWLEMSAGQFNTIDPNKSEEQSLVNMNFRSYNYDVIDGVEYQIDVTQPPRYDAEGNLVNPDSHRIVNLMYKGETVTEDHQFIVATNNYRASGGGHFPGFGDSIEVVVESPDENRQAIINYIRENGTINPSADMNWSFKPIAGDVNITFESSPKAKKYAENMGNIEFVDTLDNGFAKYSIDLSKTTDQADEQNDIEPFSNDYVYVVKAGDTLGQIGMKYGVNWEVIQEYNSISDVRKLMPGQKIYIPVPEGGEDYAIHLVKEGDTLGKIAAEYGHDWESLAEYNELANPHFIVIGQEIKIPK